LLVRGGVCLPALDHPIPHTTATEGSDNAHADQGRPARGVAGP
jgi:hypothetical protein